MFPAVFLASEEETGSECPPIVLGLLLGAAFCLRFQMAPALGLIGCWYCKLDFRRRWLPVTLAAISVTVLVSGVLDYFTLGSPFQSIWLNYYLNAVRGVSNTFGRWSWFHYVDYLTAPEGLAALPLTWLALIGCYRAPLLAATCA